MAEVRIGGGEALEALAKRFQRAADSDVLLRNVTDAVESMQPAVQAAVERGADRLPHRGGLAKQVARTKVVAKANANNRGSISVKFVAQPNAVADPGAINRGRVRHLVYGHKPWEIQLVRPGFFTEPIRALAPKIRDKISAQLSKNIRKV